MQIVVAGMALAASRTSGVLLAGGTQMLAVYALASALAEVDSIWWDPKQVVVGTTRWVVADTSADTVGLAQMLFPVPFVATQLSFARSVYPQLRAYELGYVKEGMGAGGCAAAAHLYRGWHQSDLLHAIESLAARFSRQV
jgi:NaMN:DMB phosphoribosyltransferase